MENTAIWVKLATQNASKNAGMANMATTNTTTAATGDNHRLDLTRAMALCRGAAAEVAALVATAVIASPFQPARPFVDG